MSTEEERKLFVAGLPESMNEDELRQLFEENGGTVVDISLPRHRDTGRPRGFGFVTLASAEQANSARTVLDGSFQSGRSISVRPFKSESPRRDGPTGSGAPSAAPPTDRTLYVGNLPFDATIPQVEELVANAAGGGVVRVHLPLGPDGRARGFGFVTMESSEAANAAVAGLRDTELKGRRLMVNVAHPRGERPSGGPPSGDSRDRPPRRDDGPRPPPRMAPPDSFPAEGPARAGDAGRREQRWAEKPDKDNKKDKKKKKKGRTDTAQDAGREKRFAKGAWEEWDDD